jgi:hypothetical protein
MNGRFRRNVADVSAGARGDLRDALYLRQMSALLTACAQPFGRHTRIPASPSASPVRCPGLARGRGAALPRQWYRPYQSLVSLAKGVMIRT